MQQRRTDLAVTVGIVLVFGVLGGIGALKALDGRVYDMFLHVRPPIAENPSILLLDVDDPAISKVGVWPWSRDVMADGLVLMREFGAGYAVFDIEYLNPSPRGVDSFVLRNAVPDAFDQEFSQIQTNVQQLVDAIRTGSIPSRDVPKYVSDLEGLTVQSKGKLLDTVKSVERDNDTYLGEAARFFGHAFMTVAAPDLPDDSASKETVDYAMANLALTNVTVRADPTRAAPSLVPAIVPILKGDAGAGFPNVVVDPDGVRRRIDLIKSYHGKYFAQLAFRPLLAWLGNPPIELDRRRILLRGATVPGKGKTDLSIPLTSDGQLLINWPHADYLHSFRHLTFYELVLHKNLESDLLYNLKLMNQSGYLSYDTGDFQLLDGYTYAEGIKKDVLAGGSLSQVDEYVQTRAAFFDAVGKFLNGDAETRILKDIDANLARKGLSAADRANVQAIRDQVPATFESTRGVYSDLMKVRQVLSKELPGAYCIIGNTATSTTDIGVNPFSGEYPNVGTHASVINTILQEQFLNATPWWVSLILALLFALIITMVTARLNPLRSTIVGVGIVVLVIAAFAVFFRFTGIYLAPVSPVASVFLTFVALTAIKFLRAEQEKSFVRGAFARYLSSDVINDLLANPDKLKLGGEKKVLTAMFTDVRGFSTISEVMDPTELVRLLNLYLTEMSDIIMDLRGTIDKYEGDAIISFFGAPLDFADHARRACLAAVRMKRAERVLNERFITEKLAPSSLLTRVGINTGEMVVGNMGTVQKMDYTIMGNAVNLASRLEGINKRYGTWVIMSEAVQEGIGNGFVTRRLDRVRVVGINTPVRLFELVEEAGHVDGSAREALGIFEEGLKLFEAKDWTRAESIFENVLKIIPDDGPAKSYIKQCQEFAAKAPPANWDGVFNLTSK
ncbi:MAG TPA: CHASE2 domain-containing protein [Spirochaetia bacterium]|nr:CHASE2 domain-containing protein [Spirochaetia bacterium]